MKKQTPPSWQKNAVPSKQGWRHPKTGELLVSVKGLIVDEVKEAEAPVVADSPVVEVAEEVEAAAEIKEIDEVENLSDKKKAKSKKKG